MSYTDVSLLESLVSTKKEIEEHLNRIRLNPQEPEKVIEDVCREFGVPRKILLSKSRTNWVVEVRRCLIWLMRASGISYPKMTELLDMDHSTLIYHVREFPSSFLKMSYINQEYLIKMVKRYAEDNNSDSAL